MVDRTYVVFLTDGSAVRMTHQELAEKHAAGELDDGVTVLIGNRMVPPEDALTRSSERNRVRDELLSTRASTPFAIAAKKESD
jgi:hypothetical protein